jgi:hypothetical protein
MKTNKTMITNTVISLDAQKSQRTYTPEGYMIVPANLSKIGDVEYYPNEFDGVPQSKKDKGVLIIRRTAEELFKPEVMESALLSPVMIDHEADLLNSQNYKEFTTGKILSVERKGDYLHTPKLVIQDEETIKSIEEGIKEISLGCTNEIVWVENKEFDGYFKNIRVNQISIVPNGRLGETVAIFDSKPVKKEKVKSMDERRMSLLEKILGIGGSDKVEEPVSETITKDEQVVEKTEEEKEKDKEKDKSMDDVYSGMEKMSEALLSMNEKLDTILKAVNALVPVSEEDDKEKDKEKDKSMDSASKSRFESNLEKLQNKFKGVK